MRLAVFAVIVGVGVVLAGCGEEIGGVKTKKICDTYLAEKQVPGEPFAARKATAARLGLTEEQVQLAMSDCAEKGMYR